MKDSERDQLTRKLLTGDEVATFRRQSLERALTALRQRRRRKQALRLGCLIALASLAGWSFLHDWRLARHEVKDALSTTESPALAASAAGPRVAITFISDEELFALFPDRPMALIGPSDHQRAVFFDCLAHPGDTRPVSQDCCPN